MSRASDSKRRARKPPCQSEYDVGYGKPPVEHRFAKGVCPNPKGRPRKKAAASSNDTRAALSLTLANQLLLAEAETPLKINIAGEVRTVTAQEAVLLSLRKQALAGGITATRTYLSLIGGAQRAVKEASLEAFQASVEYKHDAEAEIAAHRLRGLPIDHILPHPDDVIIDARTGFHAIVGPLDERERNDNKTVLAMLEQIQERVSEAANDYAKARDSKKDPILKRWHIYQANFDQFNDWLPPSLQRVLRDRSMVLGASQPGDFFQHTPARIETLRRGAKRKKSRT
jgi:hypothetical protein